MRKVATPTTTLTNLRMTMKEIVLRVEDSAFECVLGMLKLCQQVEVVSSMDLQGHESYTDECFAKAIKELLQEKVIRHKYDYAFILMAINEGIITGMDPFFSPQNFIDYLRMLGIKDLPCRATLSNMCTYTQGEYPQWDYCPAVDTAEELRRRNIVVRFSSAFSRANRQS